MEIAPGVHAVPLLGCTAFLACEERLTLIDAGLQGSRRRLERYLRGIGRSIDELDRVICTHAHPDHIGGVREIVRGTSALVLMHPADIDMVSMGLREAMRTRSPSDVIAAFTRGPEDAVPVADGDEIAAFGGLRVVHTPGHTPGSICLHAPRHRLVFTGDVLQVVRGRVTYASTFFSRDIALARSSLSRLAELDVGTIAFSHFPPWTNDVPGTLRALVGVPEPAARL